MTEIIVKIIFNTLNFLNLLHLICPSREIGFGGYKSAIQYRLPSNWI